MRTQGQGGARQVCHEVLYVIRRTYGGHIPKYLSKLCFKFVLDGGDIDTELIGKKFNAGSRMGGEVPVQLRFVANKKYLERFRDKMETDLKKKNQILTIRRS